MSTTRLLEDFCTHVYARASPFSLSSRTGLFIFIVFLFNPCCNDTCAFATSILWHFRLYFACAARILFARHLHFILATRVPLTGTTMTVAETVGVFKSEMRIIHGLTLANDKKGDRLLLLSL